ncbi:MAG TPA: hypothetical protein VFC53_10650 [Dehalococcoidia bacterium]|jgi:hypothetical protein|nr:hypothetical protein [Dehalococcoidia bacterium]
MPQLGRIRRYNRQFRERVSAHGGFARVALMPERNACAACAAAGGTYAVGSMPELPIAGCDRPEGCHCWYAAVADADPAA